jgi:hypothetical protein
VRVQQPAAQKQTGEAIVEPRSEGHAGQDGVFYEKSIQRQEYDAVDSKRDDPVLGRLSYIAIPRTLLAPNVRWPASEQISKSN